MRAALPAVKRSNEFIRLAGGLDNETPSALIKPGFLKESQNFEEDSSGGYQSITGYERFSGKAAPSSAFFSMLNYTVAGTVAIGNTITGATSGATARVLAITATSFVVTKVTGTWATESTTTGGASIIGPAINGAASNKITAQYMALAADAYRTDIAAVPGAGSILGVWYYKGIVYAFRNTATTGVGMYKSSGSGWVAVDLGNELYFTNANLFVNDGDTVTQGAVSAVVLRVVVQTGTLASGTNTGRLIIGAPTGGAFAAGAATSTGSGALTLVGASAAITIPNQGGRFEFVDANFTGALDTLRMYGCDGVNRGFEFDGTVFVPINTGNPLDSPGHVYEHANHLFFSFGASAQHSGIGDPYNWSTIAGAGEIACSDTVTGFMGQPGSQTAQALSIYCRNSFYIVYGSSAANWQLTKYSDSAGGLPYTIQKIWRTIALDDRGLTTLQTAQEYGNFLESTISILYKSWLALKRAIVTDSHVARDKQQYRLFFSDGSGAYITMRQGESSMMPVLFPNAVKCSCSHEVYNGGVEVMFFGSTNGFVYQMERGTSFDGANIEAFFTLAYNHNKAYRILKRYRRINLELEGSGFSEFSFLYYLSYLSNESAQPSATAIANNLSVATYDSGLFYDSGAWFYDGNPLINQSMPLSGTGDNISIKIQINANYLVPLKFNSAFIEYSPLRMLR